MSPAGRTLSLVVFNLPAVFPEASKTHRKDWPGTQKGLGLTAFLLGEWKQQKALGRPIPMSTKLNISNKPGEGGEL